MSNCALSIDHEETIKSIESYIDASTCLTFSKNYTVQPCHVSVDIVNFRSANQVITELTELAKLSQINSDVFSKVTVKFKGSSMTKFLVSYHKKVLFLKNNGLRITKDIAMYLIQNAK
jgi:hypothetical protein